MIFRDWPWHHWRQRRGEAFALRLNDDSLTWQQLCDRVDALTAGFVAQGVGEGDGVILRAHNQPAALLAWLALLQCGARVLPLNPQLPAAMLARLLPSLDVHHLLALSGEDNAALGYSPLAMRADAGERSLAWSEDRLASMTLTSGSTGLPKAAVHTFRAHLASAQGVLAMIPLAADDDWLLSLPLFHVSGQGILWRWLLAGSRLTVREKRPLEQALQGCSHASLVPTQLWRLLNGDAQVSLKAVLLGGAAIPVELTGQARERGIRSWCGYGLTEFASTVCAKEADGEADVGQPLSQRELKIVDGEVWLRGPAWRRATGATAGWCRWLTSRAGLPRAIAASCVTVGWRSLGVWIIFFFSGGEGIQPEEVERVIMAHPQVRQAFIVPLDDAEFGQRPVAVVEGDERCDMAALAAWVENKLARFQQPVRWLALPEALKTGGIKISRRALREWVNARRDDCA
ncbi:2-succinylbenzoate--CoA ligase [Raoultella terrigena]|uniref:2-succinylbenzoate--CoA ligase n=1 Tax=Raoultella terrigena TaxID=577 RepID=A0A3P8IU47_RAOTE|nr:2-succinylbenzoate--CoA ligase [Raoultella terrigena]